MFENFKCKLMGKIFKFARLGSTDNSRYMFKSVLFQEKNLLDKEKIEFYDTPITGSLKLL